ncbi:hypothetical protein TNCV_1928681 [Trichonephila clavipes]|nr:hypothetical protein TNCV_1928681 [Trichonephila clavipes]
MMAVDESGGLSRDVICQTNPTIVIRHTKLHDLRWHHVWHSCDGSIRDPSTNPLGKSLSYQFALFTTNPSEEENRDIQINILYYSRSFLA